MNNVCLDGSVCRHNNWSLCLLCGRNRRGGHLGVVLLLSDGADPGLVLDLHHHAAHHGHDGEGLQVSEELWAEVVMGKFNYLKTLQSWAPTKWLALNWANMYCTQDNNWLFEMELSLRIWKIFYVLNFLFLKWFSGNYCILQCIGEFKRRRKLLTQIKDIAWPR